MGLRMGPTLLAMATKNETKQTKQTPLV